MEGAGSDILGHEVRSHPHPPRPVRSDGASRRPLSLRLAGGVACGAMALALNHIPAPLLSSESPEFAFGGALVLFAFWQLGLVPGLVAAFVGYAVDGGVREVMLATMVLYAVEGYVASRLAARTRSLVVADVLYWLSAGALLDVLVYRWWMGIAPGYVLLLLVKQILNGVMNAVIADAASRMPAVQRWIGAPLRAPRSWQHVSFDRTVPVVMIPMTIIVLLLARASFAAQFNGVAADLRQVVTNAEEGAGQFLQARRSSVEGLARQVAAGGGSEATLREFHRTHQEFVSLCVTDAAGTILYSSPAMSTTGEPYTGRNIGSRPYFEEARATGRPVFGELMLGQLHLRRPGVEPILPLAVPLSTAGGAFDGVVMGALDAATLRAILAARTGQGEGAAQLLDGAGRIVASTSPQWTPGDRRASELARVLGERASLPVTVVARDGTSYADRLGVDPRLTVAQRVAGLPFVALVDEPLSTVYRSMIPTMLALIALMLAALLAVYAVARNAGAQLATPMQSIGAIAEVAAEGKSVPREVLADWEASPVQEVRAVAAKIRVADTALRERREADASVVERSESRYREALEQLVQAQKMESIGRLAGGIAHDFNNLLMPILGYTDLAISSLPTGSQSRGDLELARVAAERAKEVVAQLLAFSRTQVLDVNRADLDQVVAEFEPLLRSTLSANINLIVIAEPGIVVEADRSKVQQVLMNLVINAADSMPKGGRLEVRVGLEEAALPDAADPDPLASGTYGVITVSDTGIGMDAETRQRAFDPFFTTKPKGKGTGLGLSTAYGIARQHRGSIVADSAVGFGTRMRVLLPLAVPAPFHPVVAPPAPQFSPGGASAPGGTLASVMVVEDERAVREFVHTALIRAGYRVLTAQDGDDALARAAAHEGGIDLLLTDVVMPGLSGPELARRFRVARPDARVLFMSGYAADVIAAEGTLPGDADLLVKPFTPDELVARLGATLGR